ncbi:tyrosine--tRNA ligase [Tardiphaga sp. 866_E4_N2_1]|jgi:tyrosyl-tRNA synthetase|uniref:tyrosine--tRNA ligase n=1 Tax=unclassified Tardiphaga TaxID=2631404 RepID=UPI0008A7DDBC|nr:tyrosine--tRNA ligase [Tardiphaga sp. OK245]SEH99834.1 tyrosyl-tRNA synthetase [Tardiphaga sp. OK245]
MTTYKSDFLNVLQSRGLIHQVSDAEALDAACCKGPVTAYVGYDATATSLHIGNLISVTMLYWFQQTGHRPITLMGGGTSMVGDPSFRDDQRQLLTVEKIAENIEGIKKIFGKMLTYGDGPTDALMVNNADWLLKLNYVEFLRDVGRHFSVNRMLSFDSVKLRLDRDQSLSFLEFNYMIMQGYDFVELNRRYGTLLQMGGSDQWGNIINGVDLSHRMGGPQLYALTTPLLTKSSGEKMGKSASGAVWLNGDLFSPYDFWQYFRNTEDADVGRFLKVFTRLPLDEIAKLAALGGSEINEAKKILATEATAVVHGRDAANAAAETARKTFEEGALADSLPTVNIPRAELDAGVGVLAAFVNAGFVASNGEARRQIKGGGLRVNDVAVTDEKMMLTPALLIEGVIKLSMGKKRHILLKPA